jgi:hypothetical protein
VKIGLIFWFDFRKVFLDPDDWRLFTVENVMDQVFNVLKDGSFVNSEMHFLRSWVEGVNIYNGFSDKEVENQFLMRPYGGFRIDMEFLYWQKSIC